MKRGLEAATGGHWQVERSADLAAAMPSLEEARAAEAAREEAALREDPLVRAAFAAFPGAEILDESTISATDRKPWSRRA
jgi:DNA polymerase-3 subunit gamma/tau